MGYIFHIAQIASLSLLQLLNKYDEGKNCIVRLAGFSGLR